MFEKIINNSKILRMREYKEKYSTHFGYFGEERLENRQNLNKNNSSNPEQQK
jgi:hypothetical protein